MRGTMPEDHYISQTYLKHFGDSTREGMLNAYRKSDGKEFQCWPKDVCGEWDGDLNPAWFKLRPGLLGDFRDMFEPQWNPAIEALGSGEVDAGAKFAIAGLFANLMVSTPAWRRIGVRMYNYLTTRSLSFAKRMHEKHGYAPEFPTEAVEMLESGEIILETDPNHIKAVVTIQLMEYAWTAYNANWVVLRNETRWPFVTSDNPVALIDSGALSAGLTRFLPITPVLCLSVRFIKRELPPFDAKLAPQGEVEYARADTAQVKKINRLIVQCADDLVFSSVRSSGIANLVTKWAKFGVDVELLEIPVPGKEDALYHGAVICVRER